MISIIKTLFKNLLHTPGKSLLTLISVSLGVAVMILSISISSSLNRTLHASLNENGTVITMINGSYDERGNLEMPRPPQTTSETPQAIAEGIPLVTAVSPISEGSYFSKLSHEGMDWRFRTILGVNENYDELMGLEIVAGEFITSEDNNKGAPVMALSESAAIIMFGSAAEALGKNMMGENREVITVKGVYADPMDLEQRVNGCADAVIPINLLVNTYIGFGKGDSVLIGRWLNSMIQLRVKGMNLDQASAHLQNLMNHESGADFKLILVEGVPDNANEPGMSNTPLNKIRETLRNLTLIVNLLGFILLFVSSIGILSIMMIDALSRSRDIALERALGASKQRILSEFFQKSIIFSLLCSLLGILLVLIIFPAISTLLTPLFRSMGLELTAEITLTALLLAVGTALIVGGGLGIIPVHSLLKGNISDSIRES
jgi:putative ABC transport system permease protein